MLCVDIVHTGRSTFLDSILDVRFRSLNVAADLRPVCATRAFTRCAWCILEPKLLCPVVDEALILLRLTAAIGDFHASVWTTKRTRHLFGLLWRLGWNVFSILMLYMTRLGSFNGSLLLFFFTFLFGLFGDACLMLFPS